MFNHLLPLSCEWRTRQSNSSSFRRLKRGNCCTPKFALLFHSKISLHTPRISNLFKLPRLLIPQDISNISLILCVIKEFKIYEYCEEHISPIHWFCTRVLTFECVTPIIAKIHEALYSFHHTSHLCTRVSPSCLKELRF